MLTPSPANTFYGSQIWLGDKDVEGLPEDTVSFRGHLGQYLIIIPSQDLIILTFSAYGPEYSVEEYSKNLMTKALKVSQWAAQQK
ncbi:hypothetical protein CS022_08730 [Veronia nyctiphanis]|uniref:Beta-lactamase-related domain-containing protein n=1 Tax=Veronia nyctiphanis TaxID=1278244 RepID=A0A4Q0YQZ3_9GAMM|nr:hypothetical protein [Veronia nyctiphanis]RXJ73577.1 hypothetical protein CS022_08730 [Veronia nyctiphanis]